MEVTTVTPLLPPQIETGNPLMDLLRKRRTSRAFDPRPLPAQMLSDLLWAAGGISRPQSGLRTAPTALNWQEIDVYVTTAEGAFLYQPQGHQLAQISAADIRGLTGLQDFVPVAPVNLVYVADFARVKDVSPKAAEGYVGNDVGFISENVYLFCAAEGLATVIRGMIDRPKLAEALGLRPDQRIILAQTVGYPVEMAL